jgi:hypothetical protein
LIAVIGIWGTIAYKVINGINPEMPETNIESQLTSFTPKPIQEKDTFSIEPVERDPFLGTLIKKKAVISSSNKPSKTKEELPLPQIVYRGIIKEQKSSNQIFAVDINGNQYLLKKGQEINGVKLINGNSKEITISFDKRTHTILAQ